MLSVFPQLYLYEAVVRLMAGANPTETHHLLQRSTLRQRVVSSCHHTGQQPDHAGALASGQNLFSPFNIDTFPSRLVVRRMKVTS